MNGERLFGKGKQPYGAETFMHRDFVRSEYAPKIEEAIPVISPEDVVLRLVSPNHYIPQIKALNDATYLSQIKRHLQIRGEQMGLGNELLDDVLCNGTEGCQPLARTEQLHGLDMLRTHLEKTVIKPTLEKRFFGLVGSMDEERFDEYLATLRKLQPEQSPRPTWQLAKKVVETYNGTRSPEQKNRLAEVFASLGKEDTRTFMVRTEETGPVDRTLHQLKMKHRDQRTKALEEAFVISPSLAMRQHAPMLQALGRHPRVEQKVSDEAPKVVQVAQNVSEGVQSGVKGTAQRLSEVDPRRAAVTLAATAAAGGIVTANLAEAPSAAAAERPAAYVRMATAASIVSAPQLLDGLGLHVGNATPIIGADTISTGTNSGNIENDLTGVSNTPQAENGVTALLDLTPIADSPVISAGDFIAKDAPKIPEQKSAPPTHAAPAPHAAPKAPSHEKRYPSAAELKAVKDKAFTEYVHTLHDKVAAANGRFKPMDADRLAKIIIKYDEHFHHPVINRNVALAQEFHESALDPHAVSNAGAKGLTQFMGGTWKQYGHGASPYDPDASVRAQFEFMIKLYDTMHNRYPDKSESELLQLSLSAYNTGPGNIHGHVAGYTWGYVNNITKLAGQVHSHVNSAVAAAKKHHPSTPAPRAHTNPVPAQPVQPATVVTPETPVDPQPAEVVSDQQPSIDSVVTGADASPADVGNVLLGALGIDSTPPAESVSVITDPQTVDPLPESPATAVMPPTEPTPAEQPPTDQPPTEQQPTVVQPQTPEKNKQQEKTQKLHKAVHADARKKVAENVCPPGTTTLGIYKTSDGKQMLCAVRNMPSSSEESDPKSNNYVEKSNHHAIIAQDLAANLQRMVADAAKDGVVLQANSSFRRISHQARLWKANPNPQYVAPPGKSLHNAANAVDVRMKVTTSQGCVVVSGICTSPNDKVYDWLVKNAGKYGFGQYYAEAWHWDTLKSHWAKR